MFEKRPRILFVDDDPNTLEMLRRILHLHLDTVEADFRESVDSALAAVDQVRALRTRCGEAFSVSPPSEGCYEAHTVC